ncbi:MAG: RNA polymerase sigma factor [Beijerinckiaceae bacterium]
MGTRADFDALTPALRRYARGLTGGAECADDLVQDALLTALRSRGVGRGAALQRKLYAIITDFNRMRVASLESADDFGRETRGEVVPFGREGPTARAVMGRSVLAAMTLAEREAILLVSVEGFSYDEAAEISGVSRPALIARLAKARGRSPQHASAAGRHAPGLRVVS